MEMESHKYRLEYRLWKLSTDERNAQRRQTWAAEHARIHALAAQQGLDLVTPKSVRNHQYF